MTYTKTPPFFSPGTFKRMIFVLAMMCLTGVLFGQGHRVTGKVVENTNDSLIEGATVSVKGKNISTLTAKDGSFSLMVPPNAVLVISSIGYLTQEITPSADLATINVHLVPTQQNIQQIVVIGYGTAKRKDLTGAISSISSDVIDKIPVTSLEQSMPGPGRRRPGHLQ